LITVIARVIFDHWPRLESLLSVTFHEVPSFFYLYSYTSFDPIKWTGFFYGSSFSFSLILNFIVFFQGSPSDTAIRSWFLVLNFYNIFYFILYLNSSMFYCFFRGININSSDCFFFLFLSLWRQYFGDNLYNCTWIVTLYCNHF